MLIREVLLSSSLCANVRISIVDGSFKRRIKDKDGQKNFSTVSHQLFLAIVVTMKRICFTHI